MLQKVSDLFSGEFGGGLVTQPNILALKKNQSPNMMNVKVNIDGSLEKRAGSTTMNSVCITNTGSAGFSPDSASLLPTKIVAWWNMDEFNGKRYDSIGGNTLENDKNVEYAASLKRRAAKFLNGSYQYLYHTNTSTLATGDVDFSMAACFYLDSTSPTSQQTIIGKLDYSDPIDSSVKLYLPFIQSDGTMTFTDNSLSGHTVVGSGLVMISTGQHKVGASSCYFNGSSDYLNISSSTDFDFATSDFTIETYVYSTTDSTSQSLWNQIFASNNMLLLYMQNGRLVTHAENSGSPVWDLSGVNSVSQNVWKHVALVRSSQTISMYLDGILEATTNGISGSIPSGTWFTAIGNSLNNSGEASSGYFQGWLDNFTVYNKAKYTGSFTPPTKQFGINADYEYWLYVNTDQVVTFRVSSSGTVHDGTVSASSFGAVTTGTWYNVVAWHDTGDTIGVSVNLSTNTASYASGVRSGSASFAIGGISDGTNYFFPGRIDSVGFWKGLLTAQNKTDLYNSGAGNSYNLSFSKDPMGSFDFGASGTRWLTVAAGTGVFASSDLGVNFVAISTDRSATYQSFERSKNVLVQCSDAYDTPLYWLGSSGTYSAILNASAPLCKFVNNFQGFLLLFNSALKKRGVWYEDENTQITGDWADTFELPSSQDDEITGSAILRRNLYVSTKYKLFRLTFVGGNPDWSYQKIKDWGFVPRTIKNVFIKDVGEVIIGMSYDRRIRLFDGTDDKIISDPIDIGNGICDFSMDRVSFASSGLVNSFAEHDTREQVYKLCVAIGVNSSRVTHMINYNGRSNAFYPYDNMNFNSMVMAESGNRQYLMAFDNSGFCHMMDTGNLDGGVTPINEIYQSAPLFDKSPSEISKAHKLDMFFSATSSGQLSLKEATDFSSNFSKRDDIVLTDTTNKILVKKSFDIPSVQNVYQFQISSSQNTANPWRLTRFDYFTEPKGVGQN